MPGNPKVIPLQAHLRARGQEEHAAGLDLVAKLFEQFAGDAALPPAVRAEVSRLRIATLRAAQLSADFLGDRMHPARRLIDAIGAVALGLDDTVGPEDGGVQAIANAVHRVLMDYDTDPQPFESAALALEEFAAERSRASDEAARPIVHAIVQRETADLPRRAAQEEVERRLRARLWVPKSVRWMLREAWVEALAAEYRQHGEGSQGWHARLRTMDELLWSVEPKATPEGRRRLANVLAELVDAVAEGLERAQMSEQDRAIFLSSLVDCHAQAMRAGIRGLAALPDPEPRPDPEMPTFHSTTRDAGARRWEEVGLARASEAAPDAHDGLVARLRLGAWMELARGGRAAARKRLSWSSPITGALLFVGLAPTAIGVAISPEALAEKLRRGEARVLDSTALVERALVAIATRPAPQG
jgi:hypothetical protein